MSITELRFFADLLTKILKSQIRCQANFELFLLLVDSEVNQYMLTKKGTHFENLLYGILQSCNNWKCSVRQLLFFFVDPLKKLS